MKKLVFGSLLALSLTACGGTNLPAVQPAPYSAVGIWNISVLPTGVSDWRDLGYAQWTTQGEDGSLDGIWKPSSDGAAGQAVGNAKAGSVGLILGYNVISASGSFSGNTYTGQYETAGVQVGKLTGQIKMTRR